MSDTKLEEFTVVGLQRSTEFAEVLLEKISHFDKSSSSSSTTNGLLDSDGRNIIGHSTTERNAVAGGQTISLENPTDEAGVGVGAGELPQLGKAIEFANINASDLAVVHVATDAVRTLGDNDTEATERVRGNAFRRADEAGRGGGTIQNEVDVTNTKGVLVGRTKTVTQPQVELDAMDDVLEEQIAVLGVAERERGGDSGELNGVKE